MKPPMRQGEFAGALPLFKSNWENAVGKKRSKV
jgi:hypothetical protein